MEVEWRQVDVRAAVINVIQPFCCDINIQNGVCQIKYTRRLNKKRSNFDSIKRDMHFTKFILIHFQCSFVQFLWNFDDDLKFPDLIGFPWTEVEWLNYENSGKIYPNSHRRHWILTFIDGYLSLPLLRTWKESPQLQDWKVLSSPSSLSLPCRCLTSHYKKKQLKSFCRHKVIKSPHWW